MFLSNRLTNMTEFMLQFLISTITALCLCIHLSELTFEEYDGGYQNRCNTQSSSVISKATEFVVDKVCSCFFAEVNHICCLHKNVEALGNAMEKLKALRDDVLGWVQRDEDTGLQRLNVVQVWLKNVDITEKKFCETHTACTSELEGLSLCEGCSKKIVSRFRYGKYVFSMLENVEALISSGEFNAVAGPPDRDVPEERYLQPIIVGQRSILERAWNHLMDDNTHTMGLCGMGGVGKTTLLDQINNKFRSTNDGFDVVIWVVVSKDKQYEKIQDEIAKKLGLNSSGGELWNQKTEAEKASSIHNSMKKKRFVSLLDDIWSKVDLTKIGVPFPTKENKCKIVFTTRSREVCVRMGVDDPMEVKCLELDDAWELFRSKVGQITLDSHPDIPQLARKVVEKCQGLPLALNVIGETMSYKRTIQEWRRAIEVLTSSAAEFSGMDEILPVLKYSYDSLMGEHVKACFIYCSLFPEDFEIKKERLIEYWIGEGFIDEKQGREKAFDQGHDILSTLVRACLLLEESTYKVQVRMHDVIREMALWVESDVGKHKERLIVQAGVGLHEIPEVENWRLARRISLMNNQIEELSDSPDSPELTTLLLQENKLVNISSDFFQCMPSLLVLDLSQNTLLSGFPEKISKLVALRYLDLSGTKIERLPVGLHESKMLIHLDLESTWRLDSISGISNFPRLRKFGLRNSKTKLDISLLKELQVLKYLEVVTIGIGSSLVAEKLLTCDWVVKCIKKVDFKNIQEESFRILTLPTMVNLCDLEIKLCGMREIKTEESTLSWNKGPTNPCFSNLYRVDIKGCDGLKDLTWLLFAPNLTVLNVSYSSQLEDIISKEKAETSVTENEAGTIVPFRSLEHINFYNLPMLKSIYWSSLPFPSLRGIWVSWCENLRKLPLDSKSVAKVEGFVINFARGRKWIENLEWEDEATKLRFQPSWQR